MPHQTFEFYEGERPPFLMLAPTISRSANQSSERLWYDSLPQTQPTNFEPIQLQFDRFLSEKRPCMPLGQDVPCGPFGSLGESKNPDVINLKRRLSRLPHTVSLEARGVFLTTLLDKFHPATLGMQHQLPPTYDYGRDRYLAQDVYGGNGLYQAVEEWIALTQGRYPGISEKVQLPWLTMHLRQTLLKNPQFAQTHDSIQTAMKLIFSLRRHFKIRDEDDGDYIDRMSDAYWDAHLQLERLHLLPTQQKQPTPATSLRR